jgi:16S rRNA (uracil1498-N3)-methyltransferase
MPYFLSAENLILGKVSEVAGEEARHILLAHRAKKGEKIKLQGPDGKRYLAEIISATKSTLTVKPTEEIQAPKESKTLVTLFQSVVNEKALDFIFQKGTELGLGKIVLFNSANTAKKISREEFKKKELRWQKILSEAAKQCERVKWPALEFTNDVKSVLPELERFGIVYLMDPKGEKPKNFTAAESIALIVGPEGGLNEGEVRLFSQQPKVKSLSLGPIFLRAETAALASIAIINSAFN